ncbi:MAG: type VI secretion system protein TssA [Phycisphaerae bacterium]|nr:type VI secretion system protein TssA [Phycisphaerae bacterium]
MADFDETPILELGTKPISDDAPGGQDIADDEEYMAVCGEIAKLDRIDLGDPDWYAIEQGSQNTLRSKSKDVEMAVALAYTLFKKYRYGGLAAAFGLFAGLTETFWDNLFPARPRRRKNRIESFTERLVDANWLRDAPPQPNDFDAIDLCVERLEKLTTLLTEKMPDDAPDFGKFKRKIKDLAGQRPKQAEPATAAAPPTAGAAPAAPSGGGGFTAGAIEDLSGAVNAALAAATFIRKSDPTDPISYGLTRLVKWSKIELPTSDAARTQIEPPEKTTVEALDHQFNNGLWEHLLNGSEAAFRANDPLWLDLQRYTCAAMQGLGPKFEKARHTVIGTLAGLINRVGNGIYELNFRGGQPLCSGETKMWIEAEVVQPAGGGGGGGGGAADGKLIEATEEAKKLAGSGKLTDAVKRLQTGLAECSQRRDRFLWKVRLAQLCYDAKRLNLAAPLLEDCYGELQRYHIEDWEPALAVDVAQTLYRCRRGLTAAEKSPTPEALAGVREAFAWLCQLDPLAALAAEPASQ